MKKHTKNIGGTNFWGDPVTSFEHKTIRLDWNGKPSKGNEAGKKPTALRIKMALTKLSFSIM